MNVEQLIRQYLYEKKSISLPGIGKLAFTSNVQLPTGVDKAENFPLADLSFQYNLLEQAEPEFVAFVSEQTGKIKPLATSDVDSFFTLAKQFINIGKAFVIDGVGVISKQDNGQYAFVPGNYMPVVEIQSNLRKPLKVREPIPVIKRDINLRDEPDPINKKLVAVVAGVIILALLIWGVIHYITGRKSETANNVAVVESLPKEMDTISTVSQAPAHKDSTATMAPSAGPNEYRAVFEVTTDKKRAADRVNKLRGYKIDAHLTTQDSITYKLWVPITAMPADTLRKRDSLSKYFAKPVFLEKN